MSDHVEEPAPTPPLETSLSSDAVLNTFRALMEAEPEVTDAFLLAGVYARAIRTESDPRTVTDALFKLLPDTDAWAAKRRALTEMLERDEDEAEADAA